VDQELTRLVGRLRGDAPGPTLIVTGGVHGNEPAGIVAARRVLRALAGTRLGGELVALAGNLRALRAGRRYLARDLNRQWSPEALARAAAGDGAEGDELHELRAALDEAVAAARGPMFFLDLHTTSAEGIPFALVGGSLAQRRFAAAVPVPGILGLEGQIPGVVTAYLASRGATTLSVEGGQHESPDSARSLEAAILCAVAAAGLCDRVALPGIDEAEAHLRRLLGSLPRLTEIETRHPADDRFVMEPGYANISRVRAGELLARDRGGEIRAPRDCVLIMPRYQPLGDDGFFLGREVG
jgi:succinylglutamate desuccinylase